jgi:uncharacterized protein
MTATAYSLEAASEDWVPFEVGQVKWLRQDDAIQAGIWRCTIQEQSDVYEAIFENHETLMILKGRLRVEVGDGPTVELGPGDSASFVRGTVGRWTVLEDVEEFFIYS